TVSARAVAGYSGSQGCIYTLNTSGTDITVSGTASLSVPGCNVYDDSTSSTALMTSGTNATLTAKAINIVGHYSGNNITPNPPTTGAAFTADPLSYLPAPTPGTCSANPGITGGTQSLSAKCYNGLSISANANIQGIIYAPTTSMLTYTGNNSGNTYLSLVVGAATFAGTSNLQDYALANGNSPLGKTSLVE